MSLTINFEVTAEHIAAGTPKYSDRCAMALALKALSGWDFSKVNVDEDGLVSDTGHGCVWQLCDAGKTFIAKFDTNKDGCEPAWFSLGPVEEKDPTP